MSELSVTNGFTYMAAAEKPTKGKTDPKKSVNSIMANLDKEPEFTIKDVIILGNMNKKERASALGLDANKYDIRIDSKSGVVNILEKVGNNLKAWLRSEVKGSQEVREEAQSNVTVVKAENLDKVPKKNMRIENGKLVTGKNEGHDIPYVKNGTIQVKYSDGTKTYTYKDGHLLKYQFKMTQNQKGIYTTHDKGDYQNINFYPNGQIKSVETFFQSYGDFDPICYKCNYNQNGKFISGQESFDDGKWNNIDAQTAKNYEYFIEL